jgi:hypothetical protein
MRPEKYLSLAECVKGHVYKIRSRNLRIGVFNGTTGFIGIRTKWGSRYLFTEYHWDTGPPYGTVHPLEDMGVVVPEGIELREQTDTFDVKSGRPVGFDRPVADGGRGWFFTDTGEADQSIHGVYSTYKPLFDFLDALTPKESA